MYTPPTPTRRNSTVSSRRRRRCVLGFKHPTSSSTILQLIQKGSGVRYRIPPLKSSTQRLLRMLKKMKAILCCCSMVGTIIIVLKRVLAYLRNVACKIFTDQIPAKHWPTVRKISVESDVPNWLLFQLLTIGTQNCQLITTELYTIQLFRIRVFNPLINYIEIGIRYKSFHLIAPK